MPKKWPITYVNFFHNLHNMYGFIHFYGIIIWTYSREIFLNSLNQKIILKTLQITLKHFVEFLKFFNRNLFVSLYFSSERILTVILCFFFILSSISPLFSFRRKLYNFSKYFQPCFIEYNLVTHYPKHLNLQIIRSY